MLELLPIWIVGYSFEIIYCGAKKVCEYSELIILYAIISVPYISKEAFSFAEHITQICHCDTTAFRPLFDSVYAFCTIKHAISSQKLLKIAEHYFFNGKPLTTLKK